MRGRRGCWSRCALSAVRLHRRADGHLGTDPQGKAYSGEALKNGSSAGGSSLGPGCSARCSRDSRWKLNSWSTDSERPPAAASVRELQTQRSTDFHEAYQVALLAQVTRTGCSPASALPVCRHLPALPRPAWLSLHLLPVLQATGLTVLTWSCQARHRHLDRRRHAVKRADWCRALQFQHLRPLGRCEARTCVSAASLPLLTLHMCASSSCSRLCSQALTCGLRVALRNSCSSFWSCTQGGSLSVSVWWVGEATQTNLEQFGTIYYYCTGPAANGAPPPAAPAAPVTLAVACLAFSGQQLNVGLCDRRSCLHLQLADVLAQAGGASEPRPR